MDLRSANGWCSAGRRRRQTRWADGVENSSAKLFLAEQRKVDVCDLPHFIKPFGRWLFEWTFWLVRTSRLQHDSYVEVSGGCSFDKR